MAVRFDPHPEHRPVLVTGASAGIGTETARLFSAAGYPVVLSARRVERLESLADELRAAGGRADCVALDLSDPAAVDAACEQVSALGDLEVIVHNAGDVMPSTSLGADPDAFATSVHTNLLGAQRMNARLVPAMVERGRGDVVFVTSDVVVRPRTYMAAYVAAKFGLEGLAKAMQLELEGTGVRVGMVRPGPVGTEQGSAWTADDIHRVIAEWGVHGHMRHDNVLRPEAVAHAIFVMATMPRGAHLTLIEIEPEAPVLDERSHR
jgi:NADP-dependent 3-hydroxy acid dehydrogenase YdfG